MVGNPELIDYYRKTHGRRVYGTSSVKYLRFLRPWMRIAAPASILDYGCGQSLFLDILDLGERVQLWRYDPAIPEYAEKPKTSADLLVNIDVLEHIEEKDIDGVLADMRAAGRQALIVVDTKAAKHTLPDGRNAHVTLRTHAWWREKIAKHFGSAEAIATPRRTRAGFKTWMSTPAEHARFRWLRLQEDMQHLGRWAAGRHNEHWKVSTTRRE
jgi:hypothetical protein